MVKATLFLLKKGMKGNFHVSLHFITKLQEKKNSIIKETFAEILMSRLQTEYQRWPYLSKIKDRVTKSKTVETETEERFIRRDWNEGSQSLFYRQPKDKVCREEKGQRAKRRLFQNYSVSWTFPDGWTVNRMDKLAFFQSSYSSTLKSLVAAKDN